MSRSLSYLRRGLFGIAVAGALGFGVTQVAAAPVLARFGHCELTGYKYIPADNCYPECRDGGFCNGKSTSCTCLIVTK